MRLRLTLSLSSRVLGFVLVHRAAVLVGLRSPELLLAGLVDWGCCPGCPGLDSG